MTHRARKNLRKMAWQESGQRCVYCGEERWYLQDGCPWNCASIEHIIPQSAGGPHKFWNILAACSKCNCNRGVQYPISHLAHPDLRKIVLAKEARIFHWLPQLSAQIQEWLKLKYSQISPK